MKHTIITGTDKLPLTCSRKGTCCFGNQVLLNPWELATLAFTKGIDIYEFVKLYCELGGTRLLFNGMALENGKKACSQYIDNFGCSLHVGRPLVCRLYPVGRIIQNNEVKYMFEGHDFPCLKECKEVTDLPFMNIDEYLAGQQVEKFEKAHDLYLELVQGIADIAITLVLDMELSSAEIDATIEKWAKKCKLSTEELALQLDENWKKLLVQPNITYNNDPEIFTTQHSAFIQDQIQYIFDNLKTTNDIQKTSTTVFSTALLLAFSLGVDFQTLGNHWIEIVKANIPNE